jgi:hypothetical protein
MQTRDLTNAWGPQHGPTRASASEHPRDVVRSPEQVLFLQRLENLVLKRQQFAPRAAPGDWRMRLIDKAMYSTYQDCLGLGVGDEARAILQRLQRGCTG